MEEANTKIKSSDLSAQKEKNGSKRPIYFNVVFWGEQFRVYFVDYCLPSLLAPGNIPALEKNGQNKFIICTTRSDWEAIQCLPIFIVLKTYIDPYFIEIPLPKEGVSSCRHMGVGHKRATMLAFSDKAFFIALTPDLIISDNSIKKICKHIKRGTQVVLVAALRFCEENLFLEIEKGGYTKKNNKLSQSGRPLILSGREMVDMGLKSFHSETLRYNWDAPYFTNFPVACYWHLDHSNSKGILLHSFSWAAFLLDYSTVKDHCTKTFDEWTFDGDYVYKNFGHCSRIHVVENSDEIMMISWSPWEYNRKSLKHNILYKIKPLSDIFKQIWVAMIFYDTIMDPLKKKLFFKPVFWHNNGLIEKFKDKENHVQKLIKSAILLPISEKNMVTIVKYYKVLTLWCWRFSIIVKAVCGDASAKQIILNRLKKKAI